MRASTSSSLKGLLEARSESSYGNGLGRGTGTVSARNLRYGSYLVDGSAGGSTVKNVRRHLISYIATTVVGLSLSGSLLFAASASAAEPTTPTSQATAPSKSDDTSLKEDMNLPPVGGFLGLLRKGDKPDDSPEVTATGGGPLKGVGSSTVAGSFELPSTIESMWPAPGVELLFPNREVRITFTTTVDSRTFVGQVEDATGKVVSGTDGAPVLFTRSEETPSTTREVLGTLAPLEPGEYSFEWSVKTTSGKTIAFSVPFVQMKSVSGVGGSNHRHADLRLPGEDYVITFARILLVLAFAFAFAFTAHRRWAQMGAAIALGLAGILYSIAFVLPAYDSDQSLGDLLAKLEGWAAFAVVIAAMATALARNKYEILGLTAFGAAAAQATTYTPRLSYGLIHVALLAIPLAAVGATLASAAQKLPLGPFKRAGFALIAASAPMLSVILAAGTFTPTRGQGDDLRMKMLAGVVVLVLTSVSALLMYGLKLRNPRVHVPLMLVVAITASIATTAPALL